VGFYQSEEDAAYWEEHFEKPEAPIDVGRVAGVSIGFFLFMFVVVIAAYPLASPAIAIVLGSKHPEMLSQYQPIWAMLILTPVVAFFLAWRVDRGRRPVQWRRISIYALVFLATSLATGLWVQFALAPSITEQASSSAFHTVSAEPVRPTDIIWLFTSVLGTVVAWPTLLITFFVLRRVNRRFGFRRFEPHKDQSTVRFVNRYQGD